jgi:galactose-1-phosphate uridylyltransferase
MELRKDPITRSWVITGDDVPDNAQRPVPFCRFCPDSREPPQLVANISGTPGAPWSARAVVHPTALYRIEGEPARRGDGIYDRMRPIGAHEVLIENSTHNRHLWNASDLEIEQFLLLRSAFRILKATDASSTSASSRTTETVPAKNLSIPPRR